MKDNSQGKVLRRSEYDLTSLHTSLVTYEHILSEVEVEQVPHDDILDPSVLSQIPDEAFTEFFNQGKIVNIFHNK